MDYSQDESQKNIMTALTVCVAVIHENKILLTKRGDFENWCMPSGGVENGESVAQAAIRETKEETGVDIELKSLVGIYFRQGDLGNTHAIVFFGAPIGGNLECQSGETIEVRYFPVEELPKDLSFGHRERIEDALYSSGESLVVIQEMSLPDEGKITREEIWEVRKLPREARQEFYQRTLKKAKIREEVEVGRRKRSNEI